MKAWQQGYELDELKRLAAPFRQHLSKHTYGAFGLPKETDVALALKRKRFLFEETPGGEVGAAAIFKKAFVPSMRLDFAGREALFCKGDIHLEHLAGSPEMERVLLQNLLNKIDGKAVWVEVHAERTDTVAVLRDMGFGYVNSAIMASSDIKSLWIANSDPKNRSDEPMRDEDLLTMKVIQSNFASQGEIALALQELGELSPEWKKMDAPYNKRSALTGLAVYGYDQKDPTFINKPSLMPKDWKAKNPELLAASCGPTEAARHLPSVIKILDRIPAEKDRVRLMRLAPNGGLVARHTDIFDPTFGTRPGSLVRLHVPLITHPKVAFSMWDHEGNLETKNFETGSLFYCDVRKPHSIRNDSLDDRIHLVVDVVCNDAIREWLTA